MDIQTRRDISTMVEDREQIEKSYAASIGTTTDDFE